MNLPKVKNPENYVGLYVIDLDDSCSVGFTGQEVAELLESQDFADAKVYKIYRAASDGSMELKGVSRRLFELEMGMFFYSGDEKSGRADYSMLVDLAAGWEAPCKAKVQLAKYEDGRFVTAMIYPAEFNDQISDWLLGGGYATAGFAEGGVEPVEHYYNDKPEIIERKQLFAGSSYHNRTGNDLLSSLKMAVVR